MKRYMLFQGDNYYPEGGMEDYINSYDTLKEAQDNIDIYPTTQWYNIYDNVEMKDVDDSNA